MVRGYAHHVTLTVNVVTMRKGMTNWRVFHVIVLAELVDEPAGFWFVVQMMCVIANVKFVQPMPTMSPGNFSAVVVDLASQETVLSIWRVENQ